MQLASSAWRQQWGDSRVFPAGMPSIFSPRRYRQPAIAAAASVLLPGPAWKSTRTAASGSQAARRARSEEHTSELQSLMRISYAVFCLKKKKQKQHLKFREQ